MSIGGIANRGESIAIPAWSAEGILPPINASHPTSLDRSPYAVAVTDLVLRFGHTPERRTVLDGFLRYRGALHAAGLTRGFQWLDGSFLEHVELLEARAPNDIDVVTFVQLDLAPAGDAAAAAILASLDSQEAQP